MLVSSLAIVALSAIASVQATPAAEKRCSATISSIKDVAAAKKCTDITIKAMTVPAGQTLDLSKLLKGTRVTVTGNVVFTGKAIKGWEGPLFSIDGEQINFEGGGHTFDGQGKAYWDGLGGNGGVDKPKFMRVTSSGTFANLKILNAPRHVFSIGNKNTLVIDKVTIDNSAADAKGSNGKTLGHNSDCFDVSASNLVIQNSSCKNQDDCLAINAGDNIKFLNNYCSGGHGISIGSIAAGKTVSNVLIKGNTVVNSDNGLRIKTISGATKASVSDITYDGNDIQGAVKNGLVIQQDYLNGGPTGKPTNGVAIKNVKFSGATTKISAGSKGKAVFILCGTQCSGFDFSKLSVSGGVKSTVSPSSLKPTGLKI